MHLFLTVIYNLKTKASQVQLFCLHVFRSDIVDTLIMHMEMFSNGGGKQAISKYVFELVVSVLVFQVIS